MTNQTTLANASNDRAVALTIDEWNYILGLIANRPINEAVVLFAKIQNQINVPAPGGNTEVHVDEATIAQMREAAKHEIAKQNGSGEKQEALAEDGATS